MGLAKYSTGYNPAGLLQCWTPDTSNDPAITTNDGFAKRQKFVFGSDPVGSFRFAIPLSHIFGFAEDYNKVYGFVHQLVLTRASSDDNALFRRKDTPAHADSNVPDGKVLTFKI